MEEWRSISRQPGIWRIDGFGDISIHEKSAPRIKVSLSEIDRGGLAKPLANGGLTGKQQEITEPLSSLLDLLIGSCWENGHRINRPAPFSGTVFRIDTSKAAYYQPGNPIYLDGILYPDAIPAQAIRLGKNYRFLRHGWYTVVPVIGNLSIKYLVIPSSELYRFYIGVSTRFCNQLIHNTLHNYVEWKSPVLRIKKPLNRMEQFVAYRGFFDDEGKEWFEWPSNHIKATSIRNNISSRGQQSPLTLSAIFPFKDITTLTIAGKRFRYINNNNHECWAIFAANIIKCDYPSSFNPIIESGVYSLQSGGGHGSSGPEEPYDPNDFEDEDLSETDIPPQGLGRPLAIIDSTNRFSAMDNIEFKQIHPPTTTDAIYENSSGDPIDAFSYEDRDNSYGSGDVREAGKFESHNDVDRQLSDFVKMIIQLRGLVKTNGWTIITRSCRRSIIEIEGEVVTTFPSTSNGRRRWHLIKDQNGKERNRQIVWVEIGFGDNNFMYLAEMELKPSESGRSTMLIMPRDGMQMSENDFHVFLNMTAFKNRWPLRKHKWDTDKAKIKAEYYFENYYHQSITHPHFLQKSLNISDREIQLWAVNLKRSVIKKSESMVGAVVGI